MAKKVRFPLEMDDGIEVRDLESLREHFSLSRVVEYLKNGKLVIWLKDRYANDLAEQLENIDATDSQIASKICEVFGIEYDESAQEEMEKAAERAERLERLKKTTDNLEFFKKIDIVAFDQDELYDLLDEEQSTIYLCGERFSIPLAQCGVTYIGINSPIVVVDSKVEVDWAEKKITLKNVIYDEKYQKVVESAEETKKVLYEKAVEAVKNVESQKKTPNTNPYSRYRADSILNFMLSPSDKTASGSCFDQVSEIMGKVKYDIDDDIRTIKQKLIDEKIVGIAANYIESL